MIAEAEKGRKEAEENVKNLPQEVKGDESFNDIKRVAEDLKREKAKFCHNYGPYEAASRKLWFKIYKYEQTLTYSSKMRGEYLSESKKLSFLELEYKQLSENITRAISAEYDLQ